MEQNHEDEVNLTLRNELEKKEVEITKLKNELRHTYANEGKIDCS
jgi:hypothetical protein